MSLYFEGFSLAGLKVGLDFDDTVADTTEAVRLHLASARGMERAREELVRDMAELYFAGDRAVWNQYLAEEFYPGFRPDPMPGFPEFYDALLQAGAEVVVITARLPDHTEFTTEHVKMLFMDCGLPVPAVYSCGRPQHSPFAGNCKQLACERLGVHMLIDDMPSHHRTLPQSGIHSVLYGEHPWTLAEQIEHAHPIPRWEPELVNPVFRQVVTFS